MQGQGGGPPAVSVVVPVYGIEAELPRCIESILAQTAPDFELILVDDGSQDACPEICDRYAERDGRIRCIHKTNGGLSSARNAGTAAARAAWITYVDGDDSIRPTYLEKLLEGVGGGTADISMCANREPAGPPAGAELLSRTEALERILYQKAADVSAWGKLYRTEAARAHPFPEGRVFEDLLPVTQMFCSAGRVAFLPECLYEYTRREGSIMRGKNLLHRRDELQMTDEMYRYVSRACPEVLSAARSKKYSNYCQIYMRLPPREEAFAAERSSVRQYLRSQAWDMLRDRKARKKNRVAAAVSLVSPGLLRLAGRFL